MPTELANLLVQFGPPGAIIVYLMWRESNEAKTRLEEAKQRRELDHARAESDKALAASLAALTVTIQHFGQSIGK